MRALIILLAGAAGMAAQAAPEADAAAKLKQFERNLENALRPKGSDDGFLKGKPAASPVCSIPLLKVTPDPSLSVEDAGDRAGCQDQIFAARELVPPAPACEGK